ncbi:TrfB-related DNA-binding protein [Azohydromonas aeria]|uniref:TrfB-related DNA-binding protein n=1 Tax=Azohydromonas aeria TaxID=2590212 RepID=UPI0012F7C658
MDRQQELRFSRQGHGTGVAVRARAAASVEPRLTAIVDRVLAAAQDAPRDWVRVEVCLPPDLAQRVREMEAQARARLVGDRAEASREGQGQQQPPA